MLNKALWYGRIVGCWFGAVFIVSIFFSPAASLAMGSTNAESRVKIHGKGFITDEGTNQPFRFKFKFEEKKNGELRGEFQGYDSESQIRLTGGRTMAITEVAEDTWAIDFEVTVGTNGQDTARLTVSDGGKRAADAVQLELSGGYAISGEVGRGTPCKDGDVKIKVKCEGGHRCEGHPECDEHHKCKGAPNCKGHPKCAAESCKGHKQCWTVVKHTDECKAKAKGKGKGKKKGAKCKCPKYVVAH